MLREVRVGTKKMLYRILRKRKNILVKTYSSRHKICLSQIFKKSHRRKKKLRHFHVMTPCFLGNEKIKQNFL